MIANSVSKEFIENLLESNKRIDSRTKNEFRNIKVETDVIGTADGSAIIHLGKTKVICGVKAQIVSPWSDYPNKGSLFVGFEASPLSSPDYVNGPPRDYEIELARVTDRVIRESDCINLEDLCIIEGEKVWSLNIDLYSLDDFGNLYDACVLAAFAALATTEIPEVSILNGEITKLDTLRPIVLNAYPISVTTHKIGNHLVKDADLTEAQIADTRITFGTTQHYIVSGQKGGNGTFTPDELMECLNSSIKIGAELRDKLSEQLGIEIPK